MLLCTLGYHAHVAQQKQYCLLVVIPSDRITVVRYHRQGTCENKAGNTPFAVYHEVLKKWTQSRYFQSGLIRFKPETSEYGRLKKLCQCLGYGLDNQGNMVWFPKVRDWSLSQSNHTSSAAHPGSYSWAVVTFCPGVKQPNWDANHSLPSSTEVKNKQNYNTTPLIPSQHA
jgi:hypothetical protein